jgi:pimeloyl-ACP methyl ester carboxylesterase
MPSLAIADGVSLWVETAGACGDPAILLIAGAGSSLDWWPDEFCAQLAAGGRYVIRYDHRDTGQSTSYPLGAPGYTGADLAADAIGVLDALGIGTAHLVGMSAGAGMAQRIAVDYPDRVASLVLMSTTLALDGGPGRPELPASRVAFPASPDPTDRDAVIEYVVEFERQLEAPEYFDEPAVRRLVERSAGRGRNLAASLTNHWSAEEGEPPRGGMAEIAAPTLVIHGTADPLFPYPHGEALAGAIRGAELLPLPGAGHQVAPPQHWPVVVPAILRHTSGG